MCKFKFCVYTNVCTTLVSSPGPHVPVCYEVIYLSNFIIASRDDLITKRPKERCGRYVALVPGYRAKQESTGPQGPFGLMVGEVGHHQRSVIPKQVPLQGSFLSSLYISFSQVLSRSLLLSVLLSFPVNDLSRVTVATGCLRVLYIEK